MIKKTGIAQAVGAVYSETKKMSKKALLIKTAKSSLESGTFIKLVLTNPTSGVKLAKVTARYVLIKKEPMLSVVSSFRTNDITKNYSTYDGLNTLRSLMTTSFGGATLFTTKKDYQLEKMKSGIEKLHESEPTINSIPSQSHDHSKKRLITQDRPFLKTIGITSAAGEIKTKMNGKYKQAESFINIFSHTLSESTIKNKQEISVYDMGAGSGYVSFAMYDYVTNILHKKIQLTGVDINGPLVAKNNILANDLGFSGMTFMANSISELGTIGTDIVIALHACNTATDDALFAGIKSNAEIIIVSPCCHQELRKKMITPTVLKPMLKFGTHQEREAEMLTDTIRTLVLEMNGYKTNLFEFVSDDHSGKNNILVAVKKQSNQDKNRYSNQLAALKEFYGIKEKLYFESLF
jgi:hypothetical protein